MAESTGGIDGTWEGVLEYIRGPGLQNSNWPPDTWRITIQGQEVKVYLKRDGGLFHEAKAGKYRLDQKLPNILISCIDTGGDAGGKWFETAAFLLTQVAPGTMKTMFVGEVNNINSAADQAFSKFCYVATGDLHKDGVGASLHDDIKRRPS